MSDSDRPEEPMKVVDRRWWVREQAGEAPTTWEPEKPTYVQQLEQQLAEKDAVLQETIAKYRDAQREFDEARTRLRKDVQRDVERSRRTFLAELLEVVDNLDRAIEAARSSPDASLREGVELVRRQFLSKLEGFGVARFEALGERFDPARHEAVSVAPVEDPGHDGTIVGVVAPGYQIGDEVLRPAQVAVARASTPHS
jgi:molecular chaperone GrpE